MKKQFYSFVIVALLGLSGIISANPKWQDNIWTQIDKGQLRQPRFYNIGLPARFETFRLNKSALQTILNQAPQEFTNGREVILSLPMPDGTYSRFRIEHSLVVEPGLLDKYPELGATYRGYGIDDPTASARFDFLPSGFHSIILSTKGTVYVDPAERGNTEYYISYFKKDRSRIEGFICTVDDGNFDSLLTSQEFKAGDFVPEAAPEVINGSMLRTYRLALAATNEYAAAVGDNTIAGALAAQVLIMNRVNGVYEKELAIRMIIIANNNLIVFAGNNMTCGPGLNEACTAANDPYTNNSGSTMLGQNQTKLDAVIGTANYDIGHVFSTGGGGVATLNSPCNASTKARGVTGLPNPVGDPFAIDFVAHEIGHQYGGSHTFNGGVGNCAGVNRSAANAFEPGSGITIQAYAGICGSQNLAANSLDFFHVRSLEQMVAFREGGGTCGPATATGNMPPAVSVVGGPNFNIPKGTPFTLTAMGSDVNGDSLTYSWEEYDLGPQTSAVPNTDSDGLAKPIFRVFLPTSNPSRTFPALPHILNTANVPPSTTGGFMTGELLPAISRTMTFQVVARDNRANGGGINTARLLRLMVTAARFR